MSSRQGDTETAGVDDALHNLEMRDMGAGRTF